MEKWTVPQGLKRRWSDSARRSLEEQVGEFVVGIESIGRIERQRTEQREEQLRREAAERAQAAKAEARELRKQRRVARLVNLAGRWHAASQMREFLDSVEGGELFEFDPYGTVGDSPADLRDVKITSKGYTETRSVQRGASGAVDFFSWSFTFREL